MKITIHRGQNQIGGCITEIESGSGNRIYDYKTGNTKLIEWIKDRGFTMLIRKSDKFRTIIDQLMPFCKNDETCIIYSMFNGYITPDHEAYNDILFEFVKQFPNVEYCHTSGHASIEALKNLCSMVNPEEIIPIHTENGNELRRYVLERK